jgi:hypothetical protein
MPGEAFVKISAEECPDFPENPKISGFSDLTAWHIISKTFIRNPCRMPPAPL